MSVKYIPCGNAKIVVNKVTYQNKDGKSAVLPVEKISKDELESLLSRKLIKKLELDETGTSGKKASEKTHPKDDPLNKMSLDELIAKATELGIPTDGTMTAEEIRSEIKAKQS